MHPADRPDASCARQKDEGEEGRPSHKSEEGGARRDASLGGSDRLSAGHGRKKEGQQPRSYAVGPHQNEPQEPEEQLKEQSLAAGEGRARFLTPTNSTAVEDRDRPFHTKMQAPVATELGRMRSRSLSGRGPTIG
jgi:hypothetical protein